MLKKLFSFFITSLVAITGVVMMPSDAEALSFAPTPDCRVEGIIVEALFKEAQPNHPAWSGGGGSSERYQLLVHVTGTELLSDAQHGDCLDFHKISYNQYYSFPLEILSDGLTVNSILGQQISFKAGRYGEYSSDAVFTQRPNQIGYCSIKGEILEQTTLPILCNTGIPASCLPKSVELNIKISSVSGKGQCKSIFVVGIEDTFVISEKSFRPDIGKFAKGLKVDILGELTEQGFNSHSVELVPVAPKEEPKPKPDPEEPKDEDDSEDEIIPNDPVPLYPAQSNNFGIGVIVGLLAGLIALLITLLMKRKK